MKAQEHRYRSIIGWWLGVSLLLLLPLAPTSPPVIECQEEIIQIPLDSGAWGYYHHNKFEYICAIGIHEPDDEHIYLTGAPGDADYSLTWLGPNMIWIDNLNGAQVDHVSYWVGDNGQAVRIWFPMVMP